MMTLSHCSYSYFDIILNPIFLLLFLFLFLLLFFDIIPSPILFLVLMVYRGATLEAALSLLGPGLRRARAGKRPAMGVFSGGF